MHVGSPHALQFYVKWDSQMVNNLPYLKLIYKRLSSQAFNGAFDCNWFHSV